MISLLINWWIVKMMKRHTIQKTKKNTKKSIMKPEFIFDNHQHYSECEKSNCEGSTNLFFRTYFFSSRIEYQTHKTECRERKKKMSAFCTLYCGSSDSFDSNSLLVIALVLRCYTGPIKFHEIYFIHIESKRRVGSDPQNSPTELFGFLCSTRLSTSSIDSTHNIIIISRVSSEIEIEILCICVLNKISLLWTMKWYFSRPMSSWAEQRKKKISNKEQKTEQKTARVKTSSSSHIFVCSRSSHDSQSSSFFFLSNFNLFSLTHSDSRVETLQQRRISCVSCVLCWSEERMKIWKNHKPTKWTTTARAIETKKYQNISSRHTRNGNNIPFFSPPLVRPSCVEFFAVSLVSLQTTWKCNVEGHWVDWRFRPSTSHILATEKRCS